MLHKIAIISYLGNSYLDLERLELNMIPTKICENDYKIIRFIEMYC